MKIDAELVVQLRQKKLWSQEELAISSGLNLRTIQRIEREGVISLQSKKALAATFDIDVSTLDYIEQEQVTRYEYKTVILKSDISWMSAWGKKDKDEGPFGIDNAINQYAFEGWKVHTVTYGTSVHGGAGQVMLLLERQLTTTS
ncbi:DUF4177 domain-containing protein [Thalassotalea ganghwensis]